MRKIISGFLYDTDTADLIAKADRHSEFGEWHVFEHIYKKKKGEYFIVREMVSDDEDEFAYFNWSSFRDMNGNNGDEDIFEWILTHELEPLTEDQAKSWIERYASVEIYEREFGLPDE